MPEIDRQYPERVEYELGIQTQCSIGYKIKMKSSNSEGVECVRPCLSR